jgi:anthranilate 1,2-dioxygenase small subunit
MAGLATVSLAADHAHVPAPITALLADYVHAIDGDRIEDWPDLFADPCLYKIVTRDNFRRGLPAAIMTCNSRGMLLDRVVSVRRANVFVPHSYRHFVGAIRVTEAGEGFVRLQSNYLVVRTMPDGTMAVFSTGEYRDKVVYHDGAPRFAERIVVCDHGVINNLIALPL